MELVDNFGELMSKRQAQEDLIESAKEVVEPVQLASAQEAEPTPEEKARLERVARFVGGCTNAAAFQTRQLLPQLEFSAKGSLNTSIKNLLEQALFETLLVKNMMIEALVAQGFFEGPSDEGDR